MKKLKKIDARSLLTFLVKIPLWWLVGSFIYIGVPAALGRINVLMTSIENKVLLCLILPVVTGYLIYIATI